MFLYGRGPLARRFIVPSLTKIGLCDLKAFRGVVRGETYIVGGVLHLGNTGRLTGDNTVGEVIDNYELPHLHILT